MIDKNIVTKGYDEWSKTYDSDKNAGIFQIVPKIVELLKKEQIKNKGLDLGCGTGKLTFEIAKFSDKVVGVDLSDKMLAVAKQNNNFDNVEFLKADITEKFDFPSTYFDFVVSSLAVCHVQDLESFYKEVNRVLKTDGVFIFGDVFSKLNNRFEKLSHNDYFAKYRDNKTAIWNMYSMEDHRNVLEKEGFIIDDIIDTKIDDSLKDILDNIDIKTNKDCVFCKILKARKIVKDIK